MSVACGLGDVMNTFAIDPKKVHPTLQKYILADGFHVVIDLDKSHGSWMHDAVANRKILDFYSYFASLPIGHNHPKLKEDQDFLAALTKAAIANPANSDIYCSEYAAFVQTFAQRATPTGFEHLFFVAGGALAVENALKAAFDWKVRKNQVSRNHLKGSQIIHFKEAFHGRSGYTLSLTNTDRVKTQYFPIFPWPRITNPKLRFPITDEVIIETEKLEAQAVDEIHRALEQNRDDIAAIIIEPIQGEGGDNHFRAEFFQKLRNLADENELLLIFDEVQTGMGLTGKMWAYEHFGVQPDILVFGKKTQVCGIMATKRINEAEGNVFKTPGRINSTWGGNLTDMVRATKYLEIISEENLVSNAAQMGDTLLTGLQELADRHDIISNVRGRGLFCAFSLPEPKVRDQLRQLCWDKGLATLASWPNSIRFRPCLNVSKSEIGQALDILDDAIKSL